MGSAGKPLYKSLYFQVIVAIVIGVLIGHFYPETGTAMKPLGDGFIKLIKMIIAPIIFCTVVVGIAGMEDMKKVGKTGGYALLYFEIVSTIALLVGLTIVNVVQPGAGMNVDPATLQCFADFARLIPIVRLDQFALVQCAFAVKIDIAERHCASPKSSGSATDVSRAPTRWKLPSAMPSFCAQSRVAPNA